MITYLIFSAITSRPVSLLATNKAFVFFFRPRDIEGWLRIHLNKQSLAPKKEWSSSLEFGEVLTTPHPENLSYYEKVHKAS
jgi:hypothetical protein